MATLIWSKVRNIRIGDTHVPFEVKYDDGSSLVADPSSTGYALAQAVNGESGMELCFNRGGWSLNRGQPNYDWSSFWETASTYSDISYAGSGDIGYIKEYNSGLKKIGYYQSTNPGTFFASDEVILTNFTQHAPLQPYWNIENESVYVDIPLVSISSTQYWYLDGDIWKLRTIHDPANSDYLSLHSDLGDLGTYPESATWYDESATAQYFPNIPLKDITNEILYGLRLSLVQNQGSVISYIDGTNTSYGQSYVSYVPISITQEAPDFDFSVSLSGLSNLPSSVVEGGVAEGTATITSGGFNGNIQVYAFDHEDDMDSFNSMLETSLDEEDQAQYGTVDYENTAYSISAGESIDVPITYTANEGISQTDSYSIIVYMSSLDSAAYGDFSFEVQQQFDNLAQSDKIIYSDAPTIQILDYSEVPVTEYVPSEELIKKPSDVILHLLEQEFGYDRGVDFDSLRNSRDSHVLEEDGGDWVLDFVVHKKNSGKKLIEEISKSSKSIPTLTTDFLRFVNFKDTYNGEEDISEIKHHDVLKYAFERTAIQDILTEVEVMYDYDAGLDSYLKSTGKISVNENYFKSGSQKKIESSNYYGVKESFGVIDHVDSFAIEENKYIKDPETAKALARDILKWNQNQHNIINITLPLKYFYLQVGDLVEFDKMILGKKLYGEKYVLDTDDDMPIRAGQYILPLFMVSETIKGLDSIKIKAIQLHHSPYSDPLSWRGVEYNMSDIGIDDSSTEDILPSSPTGDLNLDGLVNVLDVVEMIGDIVDGPQDYSSEQFYEGDITGDNLINILDVVVIVNRIINQ